MKVRILPYKKGSKSARALALATGGLRIKLGGGFVQRRGHLVINWGCSDKERINHTVTLEYPTLNCGTLGEELAVVVAGNKLKAFEALQGVEGMRIPRFTPSRECAQNWCDAGSVIVERHLLRGSGGDGIKIIEKKGTVTNAPLYVQYIKKQDEYRVHVFCGEAIDVQRKMRRADAPNDQVNWRIRNHCNGFIFGREGVELPQHAIDLAVKAVSALGLDFGAVDLIYNTKSSKYYVLEVNCAPGLEGTTLEKYSEAIKKLL